MENIARITRAHSADLHRRVTKRNARRNERLFFTRQACVAAYGRLKSAPTIAPMPCAGWRRRMPAELQGERQMTDIKKDHNIGAGTGAAAGAATGAAVGAAGGPVGMAAGAIIGGIIGAKAGDSIAEVVNPTTYNSYWNDNYNKTDYYVAGRDWNDYEPAYKLGYDSFDKYRGRTYSEAETELERDWNSLRGNSRLAWNEAKGAVRDGWHHIERALPGDADADGR
jgi:hypothetical protein